MSQVTMYLKDRHLPFEVLTHRRAFSSNQEARALGVDADTVVKTVVLVTAEGYWLAAIPASCRLDLPLVRKALDDDSVRLATEVELLVAFPRYELGALPPLGGLLGVAVLVDPRLLRHETVVFAGGLETESVKVGSAELFAGEPGLVAPITRDPEMG